MEKGKEVIKYITWARTDWVSFINWKAKDGNDWQFFEAGFRGRENNMLNITWIQNNQMQNYFKQLKNTVLLKSWGYIWQTEKYKGQSSVRKQSGINTEFKRFSSEGNNIKNWVPVGLNKKILLGESSTWKERRGRATY